jgi:hypothetical protein
VPGGNWTLKLIMSTHVPTFGASCEAVPVILAPDPSVAGALAAPLYYLESKS